VAEHRGGRGVQKEGEEALFEAAPEEGGGRKGRYLVGPYVQQQKKGPERGRNVIDITHGCEGGKKRGPVRRRLYRSGLAS